MMDEILDDPFGFVPRLYMELRGIAWNYMEVCGIIPDLVKERPMCNLLFCLHPHCVGQPKLLLAYIQINISCL